jgi:hypothetical protein
MVWAVMWCNPPRIEAPTRSSGYFLPASSWSWGSPHAGRRAGSSPPSAQGAGSSQPSFEGYLGSGSGFVEFLSLHASADGSYTGAC